MSEAMEAIVFNGSGTESERLATVSPSEGKMRLRTETNGVLRHCEYEHILVPMT